MFIFCFLFVGICMSFSPVTPPKSNRLRMILNFLLNVGGTELSALRRAPYQSAKKTQYIEEREEDRQRYIYNKSNPSLQREVYIIVN